MTHAYETIFLIRERESDLTRVERLERTRTQAELATLKAQVDPHFLFNSLNTLGHLIEHDTARGREFCDTLADVYRFVLDSRQRDLVPLADELAFLRRDHRLLELRFGQAMPLLGTHAVDVSAGDWLVPPMALQGLLENAVKHNQATVSEPLPVKLTLGESVVAMGNAVRPRRSALPSSGLGLANLDERCRLLTGRPLVQVRSEDEPPELVVVGHADSVKGTQAWLASHAAPDVLLLDIQLADGLSLELFEDGQLALPTIFTTAYDRFAIDAFRALAIDYLLKQVREVALAKVQRLRQSFGGDVTALLQQLGSKLGTATPRWRQRLVGRKGAQFHALPVEQLAYVVSLDKLAFAVDRMGERYLLETPLVELETELDPAKFFRANR